jgi:dUTP pyrophosphatase
MNSVKVSLKKLPHAVDLELPRYATTNSAGADLLAAVDANTPLCPGQRINIPTGIQIMLPSGYEAQVRPRSGLSIKNGVTCLNSPGTIDADYRGEVGVILINHGTKTFVIERGMRIAQLIIAPVVSVLWDEVESLDQTARGANGFGSTGIRR